LFDPKTATVRYCVFKRIQNTNRLERQRNFLTRDFHPSLRATYFGDPRQMFFERLGTDVPIEPLALLHRSYEQQEEAE
jgi:hypothetical protein